MSTEAGVVPEGEVGGAGVLSGLQAQPAPPTPLPPAGTHKGVLSHLSRTFTSTSRCSSRYLGRGGQSLGQDGFGVWRRDLRKGKEGSLPQVRAETRAGQAFKAKEPRKSVDVGAPGRQRPQS